MVFYDEQRLDFIIKRSDKLFDEIDGYEGEYKVKCADELYSLLLEGSLMIAESISELEEMLEDGCWTEDEKKKIEKDIELSRKYYSNSHEALRRLYNFQQENGLTNAPSE
jgi:hypothetical protein